MKPYIVSYHIMDYLESLETMNLKFIFYQKSQAYVWFGKDEISVKDWNAKNITFILNEKNLGLIENQIRMHK